MNAPAPPGNSDAVLDIAVTRGADGNSRLVRRRVSYPWSLGRGYPSGSGPGAITIIPQAAGAGLLAGDRFRQHVAVTRGARLRVAPAGATLVHGAPALRPSHSSWRYVLEAASSVSIASEPYVLMEDANLALRQELVVDTAAALIATEAVVLAPGVSRAAWRMETSVLRPDGAPVFDDNQAAIARGLAGVGSLPGGFRAFATVLVLAPAASLDGLGREFDRRIDRAGSGIWGACAPLRDRAGLGVRIAAREGGHARDIIRELHELAEDAIAL